MKPKKRSPKLYKVEWMDAFSDGGWLKLADLKKVEPYMITTVGWHIFTDKNYEVYAQNVSPAGKYADTMSIPKGWIKKRTPL